MIRIIGALMIFLSGAFACGAMVSDRRRKSKTLLCLVSDLRRVRAEIHCRLTPLPELIRVAESGADALTRPFWSELSAHVEKCGDKSFSKLWNECSEKLCMDASARGLLDEFPKGFEGLDEDGVLRSVDAATDALISAASERKRKDADECKIMVCACFSMSALITILLI